MSETTNETRTVQEYRHDARDALTAARESLSLRDLTRNEHTLAVYELLNGSISSVIAGKPGYTQEEQVERLNTALTTATENRAQVAEAVAAAKAEILSAVTEALEGWDANIIGKSDEAIAILTEAKEFAATRDFDAWQRAKSRRRQGLDPEPEDMGDEPEFEDPVSEEDQPKDE